MAFTMPPAQNPGQPHSTSIRPQAQCCPGGGGSEAAELVLQPSDLHVSADRLDRHGLELQMGRATK